MILNDDEKVVLISEDMTLGNDLVGKITLEPQAKTKELFSQQDQIIKMADEAGESDKKG